MAPNGCPDNANEAAFELVEAGNCGVRHSKIGYSMSASFPTDLGGIAGRIMSASPRRRPKRTAAK
jgi:hypothetical protein